MKRLTDWECSVGYQLEPGADLYQLRQLFQLKEYGGREEPSFTVNSQL